MCRCGIETVFSCALQRFGLGKIKLPSVGLEIVIGCGLSSFDKDDAALHNDTPMTTRCNCHPTMVAYGPWFDRHRDLFMRYGCHTRCWPLSIVLCTVALQLTSHTVVYITYQMCV